MDEWGQIRHAGRDGVKLKCWFNCNDMVIIHLVRDGNTTLKGEVKESEDVETKG